MIYTGCREVLVPALMAWVVGGWRGDACRVATRALPAVGCPRRGAPRPTTCPARPRRRRLHCGRTAAHARWAGAGGAPLQGTRDRSPRPPPPAFCPHLRSRRALPQSGCAVRAVAPPSRVDGAAVQARREEERRSPAHPSAGAALRCRGWCPRRVSPQSRQRLSTGDASRAWRGALARRRPSPPVHPPVRFRPPAPPSPAQLHVVPPRLVPV